MEPSAEIVIWRRYLNFLEAFFCPRFVWNRESNIVMRRQKKVSDVDREQLLSALKSPDDVVRARAVGSLCPCDKGWEVFEQYAHIVSQLTKDSSAAVRASALHVFNDAAHMQSIGDAEYRFQSVEYKLRRKRGPRLRSEEAELEVRRSGRFKKRRGSFVLR